MVIKMPLRLNVAKEKFRVYKKLPKNILRQQGVEVKPPERPVRDIFAGTVMKRSMGTPETLKVRVLKLKLDTYITKVSRIVSYITSKLKQNSIVYPTDDMLATEFTLIFKKIEDLFFLFFVTIVTSQKTSHSNNFFKYL